MLPPLDGIQQEPKSAEIWVPVTMSREIFQQDGVLNPRFFYFMHMLARRSPQSQLASDQRWLDRQIHDYVRAGEGQAIAPARQQEIERITVPLASGAHGVSRLRGQYGG